VDKPYRPSTISIAFSKSKLDAMLFEAIKPCVEIAKCSSGNPASFLALLLARLECPSYVGTQPILNEALDSPPFFDVHRNLGLCY
jgi:hypothetical protein